VTIRDARGRLLGPDNIPWAWDPGHITQAEFEQSKVSGYIRAGLYDISDPAQLLEYLKVRQLIAEKQAILVRPILSQVNPPPGKGWTFYVEWVGDLYREAPAHLHPKHPQYRPQHHQRFALPRRA
jgi:hypothetical protein